jgi:hypothetical protein
LPAHDAQLVFKMPTISPGAAMQPPENGELAMRGEERALELYVLEATAGSE